MELSADPSAADVIVTNIRMRKRFERHLHWNIAQQKAIVIPEWLRDSIAQQTVLPCGGYVALNELHDETEENCPGCENSPESLVVSLPRPCHVSGPTDTSTNEKIKLNYMSPYACARASPLVCPNQKLVTELEILRLSRELESKDINALAYTRAIAVIKSYPFRISPRNFETEVTMLPYLGEKIISKIKEFMRKGSIQECETTQASERFKSLSTFTTVYGVGPSTSRELYDIGLRTIEDMELYYDVPAGGAPLVVQDAVTLTPNGRQVPRTTRMPTSVQVALSLRHDLQATIPRTEVEEIYAVVMTELGALQEGCVGTIVGGYRRGKPYSNDIDIVISHPDLKSGNKVKGLCTNLVQRLYTRSLVTHVIHLSGFHAHDALRTSHWDSLEKALTIFVLPTDDNRPRVHRRLDLVFATPEAYWTAVVGWTGSTMFERDLRLWAKQEKGMKFDSSGLTRRHDSKMFLPKSEEDVFTMLGLDWIDPTSRNAGV